jgi:hypothetical protein
VLEFFFREKEDAIKLSSYRKILKKVKITHRSLWILTMSTNKTSRWCTIRHFTPWIEVSPSAAGKSLDNGYKDPAPWNMNIAAKLHYTIFLLNFNTGIHRLCISG